ncbi:hypothetical protein CANCADRAFT_3057 [Tortispora caseinolytica NRRL Y-17796]|uniref:Uncharacterized protein n=1 Tax=Tortispora caseinolytica NRRL Y-17796 TaxID=767744 RepID=A0A1E4THZ2_9ASCO|nr:hypothetical protein CANCADRAFT_3057 [Tortispora caseinolytica NRRL Y-17796]
MSITNEKVSSSSSSAGSSGDALVNSNALPEDEQLLLKKQVETKPVNISYFTLFRFAKSHELMILGLGVLAAAAQGASFPAMTILFGNLTNEFAKLYASINIDEHAFQHTVNQYGLYFVYMGIAVLVVSTLGTFATLYYGELLSNRIRVQYLRSVLYQNIGFYDSEGSGEITNRIVSDTSLIQKAISEKISVITTGIAAMVAAVIVALSVSWKLALILLAPFFATFILAGGFSAEMSKKMMKATAILATAGSSSEEAISTVRNAHAFGLQSRLAAKYAVYVYKGAHFHMQAGCFIGLLMGSIWFINFNTYALGFWEGSRLLNWGEFPIHSIITAVFAMMMASMMVGQTAMHIRDVSLGVAAAKGIFATIERDSCVDASKDIGEKLSDLKGEIELKNVRFVYPSRPSVTVLKNMSLKVSPGQTVALVGPSGSGKSTIVGILERFYIPLAGQVLIDGHDISTLNVRWLRQQLALVSQEPTLFANTVFENIAYGLIGTEYEHAPLEKQMELVNDAAKQANAYDFIMNLPEGFQTNVGERGFLMSGGQKQRIAIARAIVSNPKILLLDEATSALDTESEGIVQDALDKAAKARTTIVIAHRLSTIKDADKIVVMKDGDIIESGTHSELLAVKGTYYAMVQAQSIRSNLTMDSPADSDADQIVQENEDVAEDELIKSYTEDRIEPTHSLAPKASISSTQMKELQRIGERNRSYSVLQIIVKLAQLNRPEKWLLIAGLSLSVITGGAYPTMSVFFGHSILALSNPDKAVMRSDINFWTGMFFMLSCIELLANFALSSLMTYAAQLLVRRVRMLCFNSIMRQDISFFDKEENSTGALSSALSKDGEDLQGLSGSTLADLFQALVTLVSGCILGLALSWKLALVCISCVPVLFFCGFMRMYIIKLIEEKAQDIYRQSSKSACEASNAIRTVASLTREDQIVEAYAARLDKQCKDDLPGNFRSAFTYSLSYSLAFFVLALGFWWGGTLMRRGEVSITHFFITFMAIIFGTQLAASIFSYSTDMVKARDAARNIFSLLHLKPTIDAESDEGIKLDDCKGDIDFVDVHFRYPTRPEVPVLRGLNLSVKKGQYVALVGTSGCGKSTTIALIESFYRPQSGEVRLDGIDISKMNVKSYRSHIALVQQEPTLYSGSIRENILYGTEEDPETVTEERLIEACRKANIYDFIMSLPEGFETLCGSKGSLLSGGQKQRIAIARALIRDPKILLLDEATSALDSESEKVVQEAIDEAAKGRTTIAVAHRLSTIKNADIIYVFKHGVIVESGTHDELLALDGQYAATVALQSLEES